VRAAGSATTAIWQTRPMDYRQLVRALAAGRVLVGATLLLAPKQAGSSWVGDAARRPEVTVIARAFGVRDLALGIGTLQALEGDAPARPWVALGMVCDLADLAATAWAIRAIGARRALPVMVVAGAATAAGYLARDQVD
jgi:hypothetical protein